MSGLKIRLLGPPQIELNGVLIELGRRKSLALLTYLAVTGHRQRRDTLATMLWPENGQSDARRALRRDLSDLNRALDGTWLETERESVGLRSGFCLDVNQFQEYLASHTESVHESVSRLEKAFELYRDDFLAGFSLSDSPEFDDWQAFQTEGLHQSFLAGLDRIVLLLREQNQVGAAIPYARRRVSLDLLCEPAHRQLMQLYAETGQQTLALRQYELCREHLNKELSVPPEEETTALFQHIKSRNVLVVDSSPAVSIPLPVLKSHHHNLPTQTTTFVGRDGEIAEIQHLLTNESGCRLLTLIGPGGIGKTRLALVAARKVLDAFRDGVYFIALAPVDESEHVVSTIAAALSYTFYEGAEPEEQLLGYLQQKQMLLVLDNFEHLLDSVDLLSDILSHASDVTLLVTSRERLHLQEEWLYNVQGLSFPRSNEQILNAAASRLTNYSAVELFLQRARQMDATFAPSSDEIDYIVQICQLVAGMPLGLELAATWTHTLSCREISEEIERSLNFLETSMRNMPKRHRSLRVVFEQTWKRLLPKEQDVLMRLSVFRGSFTREAADTVADATLSVLSSLVDKVLICRTNTGHYELHELTRQFAGEQLSLKGEYERVRARHEAYFVALSEKELRRLATTYYFAKITNENHIDQRKEVKASHAKSSDNSIIRILMISPEYPPAAAGVGKHVTGLVSALGGLTHQQKSFIIDLIVPCFTDNEHVDSLSSTVNIHHVGKPSFLGGHYEHVFVNNSLLAEYANTLLAKYEYDLIHIHDWAVASAGILLKEKWNLPLVTTLHATVHGRLQNANSTDVSYLKQIEKKVCHVSNQLIVTSHFMQQEVHEYLDIPLDKVNVVANGIAISRDVNNSPEDLPYIRRQFAPADQRLLLFVGHTTLEKGLLTLIRALPKIIARYPNTRLLVASKHGNKLKPLVYELGIDNAVVFLGYVDDQQRDRFYQIADAVIIPSLYEPFGIVALEAIALNGNIIASDVGGLREMIKHKYTGLLFTPNDSDSIAHAVEQFFADPIAAQQRRKNAIRELETVYNWDKIAAQTAQIYESVVIQSV